MKIKKWHWRDVVCWIQLKFLVGYRLKTFCGRCRKCNRIFGIAGCIPCPLRGEKEVAHVAVNEDVKGLSNENNN